MGLVLANACVGFDMQFCGSVLYPHLGMSTVVYEGNKRNARLEKSSPMAEVGLSQ